MAQPGTHANHRTGARERDRSAAPRLPPAAHASITGPLMSTPRATAANIAARRQPEGPQAISRTRRVHTMVTQSARGRSKIA